MRFGPVGAPRPPRVIQPFVGLAILGRRPCGNLRYRAAGCPAFAGRPALGCSSVILLLLLLLPRAFALRLAAFRLGHEDGQPSRHDRAVTRLWQVHDHAAGTHRCVLVRHPGDKKDSKLCARHSRWIRDKALRTSSRRYIETSIIFGQM